MSAPCPIFGFAAHVVLEAPTGASQSTDVADDIDDDTFEDVAGDLLSLLEAHGLSADRIGVDHFMVRRDGAQTTDADRQLVRAWAEQWRGRAHVDVGDLVDLA